MAINIEKVIVFGDSLSDIGTKWQSKTGIFASKIGEMTTSASGRFSDSRNWTDYMYEDATGGQSLVKASASETVIASKNHLTYNRNSMVSWDNQSFRYANYAEGGACGGIPASRFLRMMLGTFKDQVKKFETDWYNVTQNTDQHVLFLVWFGANDLYTAGASPADMKGVADKIAMKRRAELAKIVNNQYAHFMFMNLGAPESAYRYQEVIDKGEKKFKGVSIDSLRLGALIFNARLQQLCNDNGDVFCDVASKISPSEISKILGEKGLKPKAQELQRKVKYGITQREKQHVPTEVYDDPKLKKFFLGDVNVMTSDKVHPTDQVYKHVWSVIKQDIISKGFSFGKLGFTRPRDTRQSPPPFVRPVNL